MKYTIVVPLYNCEAYIAKCLKSLLQQDFEDYEVIVVNDGSTDHSLEVAKNCTKASERVRIVSQKNKGLSGARNTGIREAKAEYLIFIDADDYVEPTLLSSIDKVINNKDLLMYGYYNDIYEDDQLTSSSKREFSSTDVEKCVKTMQPLLLSGLIGYAWNKVYKRAVLLKNNLLFREGTALVEDIVFNNDVFSCTDSIGILCMPLVHYIQRNNRETLSKKKYNNLTELLTESFMCRKNFFQKYDPENYKKSMMEIFQFMLVVLLNYAEGNVKSKSNNCTTFYYDCKSDIQPKQFKEIVVWLLLKANLFYCIAIAYEIKQRVRN